jgi:hypothetical protein
VQKLVKLIDASSYLNTWILKLLLEALKLSLSGNDSIAFTSIALTSTALTSTTLTSIALTSTALTSTAPASIAVNGIINNNISKGEISTDPYELNKLNARKPSFIKDKEMIIRYKFKYFKKGNKKGQVYNK